MEAILRLPLLSQRRAASTIVETKLLQFSCDRNVLPFSSITTVLKHPVIENHMDHTVDGWNPAPPEMYETLKNGIDYLSTGGGFQPSTVWINKSKHILINSLNRLVRPTHTGRSNSSIVCFLTKHQHQWYQCQKRLQKNLWIILGHYI